MDGKIETKKKKIVFMVLFLAVVIAGFVGLHFWEVHSETVEDDGNYDDFHSIYGLEATGAVSFTNGEEEELTYIYKDDIDTYLLIGTDASGNQTPGIDEEYNGKMADFMGLLVFNKTKKQYRILLLNRDIITDIPLVDEEGKGEATRPMQLCVSHWFGGTPELNAENTVRAVSMLLGDLEIKGYYEMDMEEIQTLNHLLGGVTLTVEDDSLAEVYPEFTKGVTLTLTDEQAEHYVRARMEIGEDFNEYRMHRQINFLKAAIKKATELSTKDSEFADRAYATLNEKAITNIYGNFASRFANYLQSYENAGILTLEGRNQVGTVLDDGLQHAECYVEQEDIIMTLDKIYDLEMFE